MRRYLVLFLLFVCGITSAETNEEIISHKDVSKQRSCFSGVFEEYGLWYEKIQESSKKRTTNDEELQERMKAFRKALPEEDFNRYKESLDCINFTYNVGDIPVRGFVIKPKNSKNLSTILYNRGGNGNFGGIVFGKQMRDLFPIAEKGFIVIGSQYRGTFQRKSEHHDEYGGGDIDDVVKLIEISKSVKGSNPENIGILGESRGGMQSFLTLKRTQEIKAIATIAGMTDLIKILEVRPEFDKAFDILIPNYKTRKEEELKKRSVTAWVGEIDKEVPILLIHGSNDEKVDASQSYMLADLLNEANHPYKLVIYGNDNHGLELNKKQSIEEISNWFRHYL